MLKGKHILLGITGSIAAYKAAILVRLLVKEGAEVKVIMTPLAKEFITPLTLATLSKNPILIDFFNPENGDWNSHVDLGLWADLYLIAPATANTMAKMAHGIADNLLLTSYLSARCPVMIAPAMDLDMFNHASTQRNIKTLRFFGNIVIEPGSGELASGLEGKGRMEEPKKIVELVHAFIVKKKDWKNKKVLITAGPTHETIDPVRFIGNHSSGKMGFAIAEELASRGAFVTLISGPVHIQINNPSIHIIKVTTANQMYEACLHEFPKCDIAIMAAAVADYAPKNPSAEKIKRKKDKFTLELFANPDIAFNLGKLKKKDQLLIGFALETENELANAKQKLEKKNLDFIVLNTLGEPGVGFNSETNKITILFKDNKTLYYELKSKQDVAIDIIDNLQLLLNSKKNKSGK